MRVAVTGASGFIGGHVARTLTAMGHEVLSYGRRDANELHDPPPNYASWDVTAGPIATVDVDAVIHSAAHVGDWGRYSTFYAANVDGTRVALESFPRAARFVHISSSSVYSDAVHKLGVREDAPIGDCRFSSYGRTKALAERIVLERRPDAIVLRPHIVYGPGDTTLLPRVLAARRFGRLPIPGNGRNRLSVTHIENLVLAIASALTSESIGVFNVADAENTTVDELLRTILARVGVPATIVHVPRAVAWQIASLLERVWPNREGRSGPPLTRYAVMHLSDDHTLDITRARTLLGYDPTWTFRNGPLA